MKNKFVNHARNLFDRVMPAGLGFRVSGVPVKGWDNGQENGHYGDYRGYVGAI